MNDCFTNPPTEAGTYNVSIKGVMTVAPIFWKFDGKKWDTKHYEAMMNGPLGPGMAFWYEGTKQEK